MAETSENPSEPYDLTILKKEPDYIFKLTTASGTIVPISITGMIELTPVPVKDGKSQRRPTTTEILCLIDTILTHHLNPYAGECGLMPIFFGGFHYSVWVAAQVRIRKAMAQKDYDGYRWGWITKDGLRQESGKDCKIVKAEDIEGVWGEVHRKGQTYPYYHETFLGEFAKETKSGRGVWQRMKRVMILKVNRDQTHRFAYADQMGTLCSEDELRSYDEIVLPAPESDVLPRDERRKEIPSSTVDGTRAPVQEVSTEMAGSEEKRDIIAEVAEEKLETETMPAEEQHKTGMGLYKLPETDSTIEEKGDVAEFYIEVNGLYVIQGGKDFIEFAAFVLCLDESEVDTPSKFTMEQLRQIKAYISTNGVAIN